MSCASIVFNHATHAMCSEEGRGLVTRPSGPASRRTIMLGREGAFRLGRALRQYPSSVLRRSLAAPARPLRSRHTKTAARQSLHLAAQLSVAAGPVITPPPCGARWLPATHPFGVCARVLVSFVSSSPLLLSASALVALPVSQPGRCAASARSRAAHHRSNAVPSQPSCQAAKASSTSRANPGESGGRASRGK